MQKSTTDRPTFAINGVHDVVETTQERHRTSSQVRAAISNVYLYISGISEAIAGAVHREGRQSTEEREIIENESLVIKYPVQQAAINMPNKSKLSLAQNYQ